MQTEIQLCSVYLLPVLYGEDTWSVASMSSWRLDVFNQLFLHSILCIPYVADITNVEVMRRMGQPAVSLTIMSWWLHLFGHIDRANPSQEHLHVVSAAISSLSAPLNLRNYGSI